MRWIAAFLLVLFAASPTFAKTPDAAPPQCAGKAPTLHVQDVRGEWHRMRLASSIDKAFLAGGDPATARAAIDPRGIGLGVGAELRDFEEVDLRCWGEHGDQLAAYAVALRLAAVSPESHEWLERAAAGKDVMAERNSAGEIPSDVCAYRVDMGDMSCEYGLPEAQALIGMLICSKKRPGTREEGLRWIDRAVRGGLWSAASVGENVCRAE